MSVDSIRAGAGPAARPWRPAAALKASVVLHAGGIAALAVAPEAWAVVLAAVAANHLALFGASFAPRSGLLGPNLTRLPDAAVARREIAITFDDGPDPEITPRVLDWLDRAGARGTFFCVGARAAAHPGVVREIVRRGHAVENHSQQHSTAFGWYGPDRLRREIGAAQDTLARLAGRAPAFFRAPFGVRSPFLDPVLARLGLALRLVDAPRLRHRGRRCRARARHGSPVGSTPATCSCCTTASRPARSAGSRRCSKCSRGCSSWRRAGG